MARKPSASVRLGAGHALGGDDDAGDAGGATPVEEER